MFSTTVTKTNNKHMPEQNNVIYMNGDWVSLNPWGQSTGQTMRRRPLEALMYLPQLLSFPPAITGCVHSSTNTIVPEFPHDLLSELNSLNIFWLAVSKQ